MPQNNTNLLSYASVGQKSDKALGGLKSSFQKGSFLEAFGEIPFPCSFRLLAEFSFLQFLVGC